MILRTAHLFSQLLHEHLPRNEFEQFARKHGAKRDAKGFSCWTQLVAMLFCQLGRADSLREICSGLACCRGKLVHLGITRVPNKSTLSYAKAHRPAALWEDLFWTTLNRMRSRGHLGMRKKSFRFKWALPGWADLYWAFRLCYQDRRFAILGIVHGKLIHQLNSPEWVI